MKNKISKNQNIRTEVNANGTVEVLYQKMGDRWFAFSLIDDEVFVGSIPVDEIVQEENKRARRERIVGNT